MKKQSNNYLEAVDTKDILQLLPEVKETIAFNVTIPAAKTFTAADLWSIQKSKRSVSYRRFA